MCPARFRRRVNSISSIMGISAKPPKLFEYRAAHEDGLIPRGNAAQAGPPVHHTADYAAPSRVRGELYIKSPANVCRMPVASPRSGRTRSMATRCRHARRVKRRHDYRGAGIHLARAAGRGNQQGESVGGHPHHGGHKASGPIATIAVHHNDLLERYGQSLAQGRFPESAPH